MLVLKKVRISDDAVIERKYKDFESVNRAWWKAVASSDYHTLVIYQANSLRTVLRCWRVSFGVAKAEYYQAEGFGR